MEKLFTAYYRVSTKSQGQSGLGLAGQRNSVMNYINHNGNKLVAEYTEQESGKNDKRPELLKAIQKCKETDSILCIARLDRLSRNLSFISNLMDSKVRFCCVDMPDATELTISIFASLAQWERKRISERTREALAAKRRREPDFKFGRNNFTEVGRINGRATIQRNIINDLPTRHAFHFIKPLKDAGYTYQRIAEALNDEGYTSRLGCKFFPATVRNIWKRFTVKESASKPR